MTILVGCAILQIPTRVVNPRKGVVAMHENLHRPKGRKAGRYHQCALMEFAVKGYDLASTNEMVKAAGISKGALFHYFASKKDLFLFLCDYVFGLSAGILRANRPLRRRTCLPATPGRHAQGGGLSALSADVRVYQALTAEKSPEIAAELKERLEQMMGYGYECLLANLDTSLFRQMYRPTKSGT